jgi:hypothetical protein
MHRVERIERELVVDEEDRKYPIKEVLPVDEASTELNRVGRGLSVAGQAKRDALGAARYELEKFLEAAGGQATVRFVSSELREKAPAFFEQLAREGLSRQKPLDAFVALFPDVFELYGSGRARGMSNSATTAAKARSAGAFRGRPA